MSEAIGGIGEDVVADVASGDIGCSIGLVVAGGSGEPGKGLLVSTCNVADGLCSSEVAPVLKLGSTDKGHSNGSEIGRKREASP
jgi:hypothetical protein